jgi:MoxR-like ATPase
MAMRDQLGRVIAGKPAVIDQVLITILCGGHLLIEDIPGVGKTTLARGLAACLATDFGRIQFTADLLPADIIGVDIYDPAEKRFVFHKGPIFHHIVLADEINRATPKAQSALLEAMAEGQVSMERKTLPLPRPFLVLATQNPMEHLGTFPLPESQLDRFFMRIRLGYPDQEAERQVLLGEVGKVRLDTIQPVAGLSDLISAQARIMAMPVSRALLDYVLELLEESRKGSWLRLGISPRAGRDLLSAARARAWLDGQGYVSASNVQSVFLAVLAHRVVADGDPKAALLGMLEQIPVPA